MDLKELITKLLSDDHENLNADTIITIGDIIKPEVYKVLAYIFDMYKDLVANEDYYKTQALDQMNTLQSLIEVGFTREEAMQILLKKENSLTNAAKTVNTK